MIKDIVLNSRSYRSFDESRKITKEELFELVNVARVCPSAMNRQPLKYRIVHSQSERETLLAQTKWAGLLKNIKLPPENKTPAGYIVVCCDTEICDNIDSARFDAGIVSQTIMLVANEMGLGGCILGAFDKKVVSDILGIDSKLVPIVILALGKPCEVVTVCEVNEEGSVAYYRDENNVHFVPKRSLEDVIIK